MKRIAIGLLTALLICLSGCDVPQPADDSARVHEYRVVSVHQYMKVTKTNRFGAVLDQEPRYCFTYIGDDGQLHEVDSFKNTEYGLWKVCIGDENKYVVKEEGFDTYKWLYLTEDALNGEMKNE